MELPADSFAFSPLAKGENRGVAGALPGEQQSTGLLRLDLSNLPQRKKEPRPCGLGSFLELLARFELATRFHEILISWNPYDLRIRSALRA